MSSLFLCRSIGRGSFLYLSCQNSRVVFMRCIIGPWNSLTLEDVEDRNEGTL